PPGRSPAPSPPSPPASTSGSLAPGASALRGRRARRRLGILGLAGPVQGALSVTVDPRGYRLNRDFSASESPPRVAGEGIDDLPRRLQAVAFEVPNAPATQPHFLDRTEWVAGLAQQGMLARVINGLILEMTIVQCLANPPCQGVDRFRLARPGV